MGRDQTRNEAGDTLVEVLIALMLLSIAALALLTSVATTLSGSGSHRSFATVDTVIRSAADTLKYDVQLQSTPLFSPCATVTTTSYVPPGGPATTINFTTPAGYQVQIGGAPLGGGIEYWNPTTAAFSSSCSASWSDKAGFQLVFLTVTGPRKASETMAVGLRSPT